MKRFLPAALTAAALSCSQTVSALEVSITYLEMKVDQGPVLSNILPEPEDSGLQGARLAIKDNNTTGRFLKQKYQLEEMVLNAPSELPSAIINLKTSQVRYLVVNADSTTLTKLSEALSGQALIFNAGAQEDALRTTQCLKGVLHTTPSRAMYTDALAQWLKYRKLTDWLVIRGTTDADLQYTQALKRSAKRFGHKLIEEKPWSFDTDLRRLAQREMPLFTRTRKEYDVVLVADERGDFGEYVPYNTWYPRPVAGTQGLTPVTWHRVVEQWGAAQLQSRFEKLADRWMTSQDYAAWSAVRTVGEAVTRTNSDQLPKVWDYIRSDRFQLAGFKGRKLNYRDWSGQLRQPIPLVQPKSLVSQSPQEGFLHPVSELDTLGFDRPESRCNAFEHAF